MKNKNKASRTETLRMNMLIFGGGKFTHEQAMKKARKDVRTENVLKDVFSLTQSQISILWGNQDKVVLAVKNCIGEIIVKDALEGHELRKGIEARALRMLRAPERNRRLRAILASNT